MLQPRCEAGIRMISGFALEAVRRKLARLAPDLAHSA